MNKKRQLSKIDLGSVAEDVYEALDSLDVEDVWNHSGNTPYGYVDPVEQAWQMVEDTLVPFIDEIEKYKKLSMMKEAMSYCKGVLNGIYSFGTRSKTKFKDWAADAPRECFDRILSQWRKEQKQHGISEINAFVKKNLPDWI